MARVTVEDCITKVPNRFELVLAAAQRGRQISSGSALTVERDNDKNAVVALREIADETVDPEELKEAVVYNLQERVEIDEPEDEEMDLDLGGLERELELNNGVLPGEFEEELLADGLSVQDADAEESDLELEESEADEMDEADLRDED